MEPQAVRARILLVDDEEPFRTSLAERLEMRGFCVQAVASGEDAVRRVRADRDIDVVLLDYHMPDMDGQETLVELKAFRPEIQVIMLTGFGSLESALAAGRQDVFHYLAKPARLDELIRTIDAAAREKSRARARQDMPVRKHQRHWKTWLVGSHNLRPVIIILGVMLLATAYFVPPPASLVALLSEAKTGVRQQDEAAGYASYRELDPGESIADFYLARYRPPDLDPESSAPDDLAVGAAHRALLMIGLILTAALFWASGAVPIGITAIIVAVVMYLGGVLRPDGIAQAFAKDSVVFIFGVLVMSRVISNTGLDRRIARLLLMPVRNMGLMLFVFLPLFAVTCSFISESILIALMMPVFVLVFRQNLQDQGCEDEAWAHRKMLVMFALMLCYASNVGGPGSPAAGGRNAVMVGILADYGMAPTFLDWMKYGLPFVPVAALAVGLYFYLVFRTRIPVRQLDVAAIARNSSERLGPMNRDEYVTAATFLLVIGLWVFGGERLGLGGPILMGLVILNILGVMKWSEITRIHWDVVFLYAGASALGKGLAVTGGALYMARGFVSILPDSFLDGAALDGMILPIAVSLLTGLVTNIMTDGATVAALGPIAVPMATDAGIHPWAMGFATAFASSFPHLLIIGTPANALVYIMCRDPHTGRQLVTQKDFLKHGAAVFILSFIVLWVWAILGYWRWIGF